MYIKTNPKKKMSNVLRINAIRTQKKTTAGMESFSYARAPKIQKTIFINIANHQTFKLKYVAKYTYTKYLLIGSHIIHITILPVHRMYKKCLLVSLLKALLHH